MLPRSNSEPMLSLTPTTPQRDRASVGNPDLYKGLYYGGQTGESGPFPMPPQSLDDSTLLGSATEALGDWHPWMQPQQQEPTTTPQMAGSPQSAHALPTPSTPGMNGLGNPTLPAYAQPLTLDYGAMMSQFHLHGGMMVSGTPYTPYLTPPGPAFDGYRDMYRVAGTFPDAAVRGRAASVPTILPMHAVPLPKRPRPHYGYAPGPYGYAPVWPSAPHLTVRPGTTLWPPGMAPNAKPQISYAALITEAILSADDFRMTLAEIYDWIKTHYPYYRTAPVAWQNSVRHNLSLNRLFMKIPRPDKIHGKGGWWSLDERMYQQKFKMSLKAAAQASRELRQMLRRGSTGSLAPQMPDAAQGHGEGVLMDMPEYGSYGGYDMMHPGMQYAAYEQAQGEQAQLDAENTAREMHRQQEKQVTSQMRVPLSAVCPNNLPSLPSAAAVAAAAASGQAGQPGSRGSGMYGSLAA